MGNLGVIEFLRKLLVINLPILLPLWICVPVSKNRYLKKNDHTKERKEKMLDHICFTMPVLP
jgi:hypothetical protein